MNKEQADFQREVLKSLEELNKRVASIERKITPTAPNFIPVFPSPFFTPDPIQPGITNCEKCGLKLERVMCYSCPHSDCPVGLGSVFCGV